MKLLFRGLLAGSWFIGGFFLAGCSSPSNDIFLTDNPRPPASVGQTTSAAGSNPAAFAQGVSADVARFRVGETVIVTFSGLPLGDTLQTQPHQETIKEDGTITLPLIGSIRAAGKTSGELQKDIYDAYVPKYYVRMTVTVQGASTERVVYVSGEVNTPGRVMYLSDMTVTKAIQAAGGLNNFASPRKVWLTHAGSNRRILVNYKKAMENPAQDPPVYPDDQIYVGRSW
ncbi:MAG TPA: polysaccharide biosynthesis/export family protein [Verrucomicrobiae bacterium]|nr:polysaccharide biosynthesis/export family protein [Verrucomicrobiae bacterium]